MEGVESYLLPRNGPLNIGASLAGNLVAELKARTDNRHQAEIASADRRERVLSAIILDAGQATSELIAAIKEMNKIEGRHYLKRQVVGGLTLEQVIEASRA